MKGDHYIISQVLNTRTNDYYVIQQKAIELKFGQKEEMKNYEKSQGMMKSEKKN